MKSLRLYFIGSGIALILYVLAQYYKPQPTDWTPTYLKEDKNPFGLYILNQEFRNLFPEASIHTSRLPIYNTIKDKNFKNSNYLLIAGNIKADRLDYQEMVNFMKRGNNIFIAASAFNNILTDTLKLEIKTPLNINQQRSIPVNFVNPALKAKSSYIFDKGLGEPYFSKIDTLRATVLSKNESGKANFIRYNFGKGALYILSDPDLLSNYSLLNPKSAEYAAKSLSYLPAGNTLIFDEYNTKGSIEDSSVLRVFMKYDPLRWAYVLSITGLIIFIVFEIKRRQRIIPITEPLTNSSVEFAELVGKVYYQQRNNTDLAQKIINYLLEQIRTKYRLKTLHLNEEFAAALTIKSGAAEETVNLLFQIINNINNTSRVTDEQLISLNKIIEKFYKQAR